MAGLFFSFLLAAVASAAEHIPVIPSYQIGETAVSDVISPIPFSVPNSEETKRLKELETEQSPLVFRHSEKAGAEAELALAETIAWHREKFLEFMEQSARRRVLDSATLEHPSFAKFVKWYQEREKSFPLTMSLARLWALGRSDELVLGQIAEKLQATMGRFICDEPIDPNRPFRVIPRNSAKGWLSFGPVAHAANDYSPEDLLTLEAARRDLEDRFWGEQRSWGKFVAAFVRPNCSYDAEATREYKHDRLSKIAVADHYHAGDLIVSSGETIDTRIKRALDLLYEKRMEQEAREVKAAARREKFDSALARVDTAIAALIAGIETFIQSEYRAPAGIAVCLLLLLWLRQLRKRRLEQTTSADPAKEPAYAVVVNRNRQETIFVPLSEGAYTASGNSDTPAALPAKFEFGNLPEHISWEEKVFAAEKRAEELMELVRTGLAPHLAKHLMSQFVRGLLTQRNQLLQTQKLSESQLTRLEAQFAVVQKELTDRLGAFELRNAELERELAEKRKENRELIETMMGLTRAQQEKAEAV